SGRGIAAAHGPTEVPGALPPGAVRRLADGVAGRAILAFLPPDAPDAKPIARALADIRKRGFATEETAFARGRAGVAFPIRRSDQAIAAIAIEGPVLDLARPGAHADLPHWREIVSSLERLAAARPALFAGPFDHLNPDDIVLS